MSMFKIMMVKNTVKNANETGICSIGKSNVRENEFSHSVKYLRTLGFSIFDKCTNIENNVGLAIIVDDSHNGVVEISPYEFIMSKKTLMSVANRLNTAGVSVSLIIRAYSDAINDFTEDSIKRLRNYKLEDIVDYICDVLEANGVNLNGKKTISSRLFRDITKYLGGYSGMKAIIVDAISAIADNDEYVPGPNNECVTCKHCRFDECGNRYCNRGIFEVPEEYTVKKVNELYPEVEIDGGVMWSKYTPIGMYDCRARESRQRPRLK